MFYIKLIIAGLVVAALVFGGVVEVKLHPQEIVNVPGRLLALVKGEDLLAQGQDYVKGLIASVRSGKEEEEDGQEGGGENKEGEVAGAQDEEKVEQAEAKKEEKKEESKDAPSLTIPLRF